MVAYSRLRGLRTPWKGMMQDWVVVVVCWKKTDSETPPPPRTQREMLQLSGGAS
jgi:hypothetical protein